MAQEGKEHYSMYILGGITLLALFAAGYLYTSLTDTEERLQNAEQNLQEEIASLQTLLNTSRDTIASLETELASTTALLDLTEEEREDLERSYRREKEKNDEFEDQIEEITGTVGVLDKLSKTDPELLQKYSKVYFLNEHYMPEKLVEIDTDYLYSEDEPDFLHAKVMPFFEDMVEAAKDDGVNLWVVSAYRSFDEQAALKGQYLVTYGSGANTFSADQGYSEHQLGTTIDFTTNDLGGGLAGFGETEAYEWLLDNAYKYGFALSYPENNAYYVFEPWHWRFVGRDLARYLDRNDLNFYDVDQRKINEYLVSLFD